MLKSSLCYSNAKARRMKDRKAKIKAIQASFKDGLYLLICLLIGVSIFNQVDIKIQAKGIQEVRAKEVITQTIVKEVITKAPDERIIKLRNFLTAKNSPLADYSELIISESDKWDIGYTKIVSISCIESACGLRLPLGSYNAWGLGGSNFMYFHSWEESIKYVTKLIGTNYKHNELQGIKQKYCPASDGCNPNWTAIVAKASNDILGL